MRTSPWKFFPSTGERVVCKNNEKLMVLGHIEELYQVCRPFISRELTLV